MSDWPFAPDEPVWAPPGFVLPPPGLPGLLVPDDPLVPLDPPLPVRPGVLDTPCPALLPEPPWAELDE